MPAAPEVAMLFSTFDNIATKFRFPIKGILGWPNSSSTNTNKIIRLNKDSVKFTAHFCTNFK